VAQQRTFAGSAGYDRLVVPSEVVYPVFDPDVAARLGIDLS
jgi:hypothetical protein